MNRWTTLDPEGVVDGPNLYEYVRGRPVNLLDILGLESSACPDCSNLAILAYEDCVLALAAGSACAIAMGYCAKCLISCALFPVSCSACVVPCISAAGACAAWKVMQRRCERSVAKLKQCQKTRQNNCCDQGAS